MPFDAIDEVVCVAEFSESGVTVERITGDFSLDPMTWYEPMSRTDIDQSIKSSEYRIEAIKLLTLVR